MSARKITQPLIKTSSLLKHWIARSKKRRLETSEHWQEVNAQAFHRYLCQHAMTRSQHLNGITTLRNNSYQAIARMITASIDSTGTCTPTRYFVPSIKRITPQFKTSDNWCNGYPVSAFQ